jgi:hypothetical protein
MTLAARAYIQRNFWQGRFSIEVASAQYELSPAAVAAHGGHAQEGGRGVQAIYRLPGGDDNHDEAAEGAYM